MDLSTCKLLSEADDSYHIAFPSGRKFTLDKKGLSEKAHQVIMKLKGPQKAAQGMMAPEDAKPTPDSAAPFYQSSETVPVESTPTQDWIDKGHEFLKNLGITPDAPAHSPTDFEQEFLKYNPQYNKETPAPTLAPGAELQPQVPAMGGPQSAASMVSQDPSQKKVAGANNAFEAEKAANLAAAGAISGQGAAEVKDINEVQDKINAMQTQEDILKKYEGQRLKLEDAYKSQKLDPDRYLHSMSTSSKIATGIGLLLSGFGSGASGQQNMAAQMLNKSIDNDIESQKMDQSKSMNLWKMNREALGNDMAANLATKNQLYEGLKYKLAQAASQFKGPLALAQYQAANAKITQEQKMNEIKLSLMDPSSSADPATKIQWLVPPDKQIEVSKEIKRAQDTTKMAPEIMKAFDEAYSKKHWETYVPGVDNIDQKNFLGLLGTTVQDLEGSAARQRFEALEHSYKPAPFRDSAADVAKKRAGLEEYVTSKQAAPLAKTFNIDLQRHASTNPGAAIPAQTAIKGNVQYKKVPGGWVPVK